MADTTATPSTPLPESSSRLEALMPPMPTTGANLFELLHGQAGGILLGAGVEHSTHTDVVRPGLLGGYRLLDGSGGDTQDFVRANHGPNVPALDIGLAHVDPVGINVQGDFHAVIDYKGDTVPGAQLFEVLGLLLKGRGIQVLLSNLQEGGAALQYFLAHVHQSLVGLEPHAVGDGVEQHGAADFIVCKLHSVSSPVVVPRSS